jgi:GntR family transcriptional regulator / MocR family aminotransferase
VPGIELEAGKPFPHDRIFAFARPGSPIDPEAPTWAKKGLFVMLMLDEALARVRTNLDTDTLAFTAHEGDRQVLAADLTDPRQVAEVEAFFHRLVPKLRAAPRLGRAQGGHFVVKPDNVLSLINLATVRSLEERWGYVIDSLRFRANFGARPWEKFERIGADISIGDGVFGVDRRNGRCGARPMSIRRTVSAISICPDRCVPHPAMGTSGSIWLSAAAARLRSAIR